MRRAAGLSALLLSSALVLPTASPAAAAPAPAAGTTATTTTGATATTVAASMPAHRATLKPRHRSDWRAATSAASLPRMRPLGVVVHHTESTNRYTRAQVPALIKEIQRYHMQERGWDDIGYHLVVDRFGRVWEGRPGGLSRPTTGAHVADLNSHFLGVAYLGDTTAAPVTEAAVRSIVDVTGWAAARYGFAPRGQVRIDGVSRPVMAGHSKYGDTLCPGRSLALRMPEIRVRATERAGDWRRLGTPWTYAKL